MDCLFLNWKVIVICLKHCLFNIPIHFWHVFKRYPTDGGNSWSNITYNLSDMPIHSVVIDHTDSSNIYIGAEIGVYTKAMNSTTWSLYNPFLPNTTIRN